MKTYLFIGLIVVMGVAGTALFSLWQVSSLAGGSKDPGFATNVPPMDSTPAAAVHKPQPLAAADVTEYDFGQSRNHVEGFQHAFTVRNEGDAPLKLLWAHASCGECTFFELPEHEIPPGSSAQVIVKWNIETLDDTFRQTVTVHTNDTKRPTLQLVVTGKVLQSLRVTPKELVLSSVQAGKQSEARLQLYSFFSGDFELLETQLAGNGESGLFELTHRPLPKEELIPEARSGQELLVVVKPGLPLGAFRHTIRLKTNLPDEPQVEIPLSGMVVGDVSIIGRGGWNADQGTLRIGAVTRQEGATRTLFIIVRGEHRNGFAFDEPQSTPHFLKASIGEATEGTVTRIPITIEIPPDSPPANYMGGEAGELGEVILPTNNPELGRIRLRVQFAVEG